MAAICAAQTQKLAEPTLTFGSVSQHILCEIIDSIGEGFSSKITPARRTTRLAKSFPCAIDVLQEPACAAVVLVPERGPKSLLLELAEYLAARYH